MHGVGNAYVLVDIHLLMINCNWITNYSKSFITQDSYFGQASVEITSKRARNEEICRQFSLYCCGCAPLPSLSPSELPRGHHLCSGSTNLCHPRGIKHQPPFPAGPWGHWRCWVSLWESMDLPPSAPYPVPWLGFSANSILNYRLTDVTLRKLLLD